MPLRVTAQEEEILYTQPFPDTLNLRLLWVNKGLNLRVKNNQGDSVFSYGPQYRPYAGFGGFLWNIGFNFLVPLPQTRQYEQIKRFDFQGSLFAKYWLIDGIYQRYKGYYIHPVGSRPNALADYFNSDLLARKIQASITYLPEGDKISLRSPFNQGNRQIKSAGSFLLSGGFSYFKLQGEQGILPRGWITPEDPSLIHDVRLASITSLIGYTGTWVLSQRFYLHLYGLAGLGFQQKRLENAQTIHAFSVKPIYDGRAGFGYDNGHFYAGVYGVMDYASFQVETWNFQELSSQLRLFVGIRLTEPAFLQKIKPGFLERLRNSPNIPLPPIFG